MRRLTVRAPLGFDAVRAELDVPAQFPAEVLAEADRAPQSSRPGRRTTRPTCRWSRSTRRAAGTSTRALRNLAARPGGGFRVSYAIADVAAFVRPGGAVDAEARRRTPDPPHPDLRTPLHPPSLGEGAAGLLPDQVRPAVLWRIDLDPAGEVAAVEVRRALVRGRTQLDYPGLQAAVGTRGPRRSRWCCCPRSARCGPRWPGPGTPPSWRCPSRRCCRPREGGGWTVRFRRQLPVERWNAQVSLLTGACAARLMLDAGVGLLRTLPAPRPGERGRAALAGARARGGLAGRGRAWRRDLRARRRDTGAGRVPGARGGAAARGRVHAGGRGGAGRPAAPRRRPALRARHRADPAAGRPVRQRGLRGARRRRAGAGLGPGRAARAAGAD